MDAGWPRRARADTLDSLSDPSSEPNQQRPLQDGIADVDRDLLDATGARRLKGVLHFHRVEHQQRRSSRDVFASLEMKLHDASRHRSPDVTHGRTRGAARDGRIHDGADRRFLGCALSFYAVSLPVDPHDRVRSSALNDLHVERLAIDYVVACGQSPIS
jgi:hypothetical protein